MGVDWKVLKVTGRHLPGREVETTTITLASLKLKASYDIEWKLPQMHTPKVLIAWPGHTLMNVSQFSFNKAEVSTLINLEAEASFWLLKAS